MIAADDAGGGLGAFQDAFAAALVSSLSAEADSPQIAPLVAQPGFAVYRNTVVKACIDALESGYPAVTRLVGEAWFRAAAALYVPAHPPKSPVLLDYGRDFAAFLDDFVPARALPYLAGVARLERFWTEAHMARDDAPVAAAWVAGLSAAQLAATVLRPHAAARWAWFDESPVLTIWQRNREADAAGTGGGDAPADVAWQGEGALITRPHGRVIASALARPDCAFLDECARGHTLADAAAAALAVDPRTDLAALMSRLLVAGALSRNRVRRERSARNS